MFEYDGFTVVITTQLRLGLFCLLGVAGEGVEGLLKTSPCEC